MVISENPNQKPRLLQVSMAPLQLFDLPCDEVARQLTLLDFELYSAIQVSIRNDKEKKEKAGLILQGKEKRAERIE